MQSAPERSRYRSATMRRQLFVSALLCQRPPNATRAAIAAGYKPSNARFYASRLLRKPEIRAELKRKMAESWARIQNRQDVDKSQHRGYLDWSAIPVVTRTEPLPGGGVRTITTRTATGAMLQRAWREGGVKV